MSSKTASKKNLISLILFTFLISESLIINSRANEKNTPAINAPNKEINLKENEGYPQISFKEPSWDFGKIQQGIKVSHEFEFTNIGNKELIITGLITTCGCTAAIPSRQKLKNSEQATIKVTFDSTGRKNEQSKSIFVMTNDPKQPKFKLTIKANVQIPPGPRINISHPIWDLGVLDTGSAPSGKIKIKNDGVRTLEITDLRPTSGINAEIKPRSSLQPKEEAEIIISFQPINSIGIMEKFVSFATNDSTQPRATIRILGYVKGILPPAITIAPQVWDFGIIGNDNLKSAKTTISLINSGGSELTILKINLPDGFESDLKENMVVKPKEEIKFTILLSKITTAGTIKKFAFIYSNDPAKPAQRIDICGYINGTKDQKN